MHIQPTPAKSLRAIAIAFLSLASASFGANTPSKAKNLPPGIKLNQRWDTAMREGITVMAEIRDLISPFAKPEANLSAPPGSPLYKGVTYLMPLEDARTALGLTQRVNSKMLIITPGFPNRSIHAHMFSGNFDGFETMYLVTDTQDQVVAVEFLTAHVKKTNLSWNGSKKQWRIYDLVNGSTKASSAAEVHHETRSGKDFIMIDSVLITPEPTSGTRIFIAQPFAQLILYRIIQCGV